MSVQQQQLYCFRCGDFVYDAEVDMATAHERSVAIGRMQYLNMVRMNPQNHPPPTLFPDIDYQLVRKYAHRNNVPYHHFGLRGLINMGNTCFMNCILQALIHNPFLRNYFLGDFHNRDFCARSKGKIGDGVCLACELDAIFSQAFSGTRTPYSPHQFLYSVWKHASSLAGYEQQDAHEFLIAVLNGIHTHCSGTPTDCKCIVHRIFGGIMRSDVTCTKCGQVSTAHDPFVDISLDLSTAQKETDAAGMPRLTLHSCLRRFTQAEKLETPVHCDRCRSPQPCTKQLSLRTLPPCLILHLKRFEQNAGKITLTKIDTYTEFPEELDMTPYLSSRVLSGKVDPEPPEVYELYCVVNHKGMLDNGHYTNYVKHCTGGWVHFDDAFITKTAKSNALESQAYLLFYIKKLPSSNALVVRRPQQKQQQQQQPQPQQQQQQQA